MTRSFSTIAIFFSRPLTLTINSLDIDFLSEERTHPACGAQASVPAFSFCLVVVGSCRQNMPAVDLRLPPAKTSGDAFDIDQIDRDHSRKGFVPPAIADGYRIDSNGNSAEPLSHAQMRQRLPGSEASVIL